MTDLEFRNELVEKIKETELFEVDEVYEIIDRILNGLPEDNVTKLNSEKVSMNHSVDYDERFDILRIREVGKGNFDYYGATQENGLITEFRDINTDELKGFEIHNFMKQIGILEEEKKMSFDLNKDVIDADKLIHSIPNHPNFKQPTSNNSRICNTCNKEDVCMYKEELNKALKDITDISDRVNVFVNINIECKKWSGKITNYR